MTTLHPTHIAETILYSDDLDLAEEFYLRVLNLKRVRREDRFRAFKITEQEVLLIFKRGASVHASEVAGGIVPPHDGSGPLHLCFGMEAESVSAWEAHLNERGVKIESRVNWPSGSVSLYFRDPDCHAVELATPGLWDDPAGM